MDNIKNLFYNFLNFLATAIWTTISIAIFSAFIMIFLKILGISFNMNNAVIIVALTCFILGNLTGLICTITFTLKGKDYTFRRENI